MTTQRIGSAGELSTMRLIRGRAAPAPRPNWPRIARILFRALKNRLRGDVDKAKRLLTDARVELIPPPPDALPLAQVLAQLARSAPATPPLEQAVDVVIPVHNGLDHLRRLFATLFDRTDPRHRFLILDDASTDPAVGELLAEVAAQRPNVRLLRAGTNRGFVATVNWGLRETEGHAVLLNTDTEVPPGWLDRLVRPILTGERIASTTPFSNAAAIYSFPVPDRDNPLPEGVGLLELDRAFAQLSADPTADLDAPTGIGFCMGINRSAWNAVGPFDEETFGRGYGEETDWCLRAATAGWRNILVPNLFVYHQHGGSFGQAAKKAQLDTNLRALYRRWPRYHGSLSRFRRRDPWVVRRCAAVLALACAPSPAPSPTSGGAAGTTAAGSPDAREALETRLASLRAGWAGADRERLLEFRRGPVRAVVRDGG